MPRELHSSYIIPFEISKLVLMHALKIYKNKTPDKMFTVGSLSRPGMKTCEVMARV